MPGKKKRSPPKKLLSHTRPLPSQKNPSNLSSKATRSIIRSHHNLQKQLAQALAAGDDVLAASLRGQINDQGGLQAYQRASIQGQASERGGDSSRVLMQWIHEAQGGASSRSKGDSSPSTIDDNVTKTAANSSEKFRLLEVGSLRPDNACARSGLFEIVRIDLKSQHPDIQEQDFMERPVPAAEALDVEGFDIVSLSLVLNYVSDAASRGELLKRVRLFLREKNSESSKSPVGKRFCPGLFLVLPAPCILNSRYFDKARLRSIMEALGYRMISQKQSNKLVYYYWKCVAKSATNIPKFGKEERRKGKERNNFAVTI